jgi:CheY-like chemotaxis protein
MQSRLILLVEDDPTLRFLGKRQLKQLRLECHTAENGAEAVKLATSGTAYAAIFMDLGLPVMDGVNAAMRIREHELKFHLPRVPIIALTAFPAYDRCKLAGMDDFVLKPVRLETLRELLVKWQVLTVSETQG